MDLRPLSGLLEPELHPGWRGFRVAFAVAGGLTWLSRAAELDALYARGALIVQAAEPALTWSPAAVWAWWTAMMIGFGGVASGRFVQAGAGAVALALLALRAGSPYTVYLYDQLLLWQAFALLFHPRGQGRAPGSPFGRHLLTLTYMGLYAGTGLSKLARTWTWFTGEPLAMALLDARFAGGALAQQLSGWPLAMAAMGSATVVFEVGFAPALLHPWTRRAWLGAGVLLHLGILLLMEVHTFSLVALAAYPLLLSARDARAIGAWISRAGGAAANQQ